MRINIKDIETNVSGLVKSSPSFDLEFIYNLLLAYGKPKTAITRLKKGDYNLAPDKSSEIYWKSTLLFKHVPNDDLHATIDDIKRSSYAHRHNPRFIIVSDFKQLLAIDTKTDETLDIPLAEINRHYAFFLPWAGMEKSTVKTENIADIKAAERMAKLYDEIIKYNESNDPVFYHALNVFFSRLLFCFFAEDTEVFAKNQFTSSIASHTQDDGSDLNEYLDTLFKALDVEDKGSNYPAHIAAFPYVNGGLFGKYYPAPRFSGRAKRLILECGELNWSEINPDIFGSMIQAVVHPGQRAGLGMHYTSVVNIMKVIEPLFLDDLHDGLIKAGDDVKKLTKLLHRIYAIKIFDPACGSGNFLIIAYKELRKIEHSILERLLQNKLSGIKVSSGLKLENFYGIEIDDFAHEVAILSLWLAKHQMNIEFKKRFGKDIPLIPLKDTGNIICGNATRLDWRAICPNDGSQEIYLVGNPPYQGAKKQEASQKQDFQYVFADTKYSKNLDYIALWFIKGASYIEASNAQLAFVSTNSLCQGDHVGIFWPHIYSKNVEASFAYTTFKWSNNAKSNAGVMCIILALRNVSSAPKYLYIGTLRQQVENINPYLAASKTVLIERRKDSISKLPPMVFGSMPRDGGELVLNSVEAKKLVEDYPEAKMFVKKYFGSAEFIRGSERYCIWIKDIDLDKAVAIPPIKEKLDRVKALRLKSDAKSTRDFATSPHRFVQISYQEKDSIFIPEVSSERRDYMPIGYIDKNTVTSNKAFSIYDAEPFVFGLLTSRLHMCWLKSVAGRMKSDISYSSTIVYNNFPVPHLSDQQKQMITNNVFEILDIRERYSEKTLADLYDPDRMPNDLLRAHHELDEIVEHCYRARAFTDDEDRLSYLFKLYETMIETQKELM